MTKNAYNDYEEVEKLVEQIVDNKDAYYKKYHTDKVGTGDEDKYHLYLYGDALLEVFYPSYSNSRESILEWQYNGINNSNTALENHYYKLDKNASNGTMMASQIFNTIEATANKEQAKKVFFSKNDYRFWNNVYDADNAEAEQMAIRKMVFGESSAVTLVPPATSGLSKSTSRGYDNFRQNWVVYRITDLMLMEAEALVARSTDADEDNLTNSIWYRK